jgi:DNA-binding Lrp family transcriptional regulator
MRDHGSVLAEPAYAVRSPLPLDDVDRALVGLLRADGRASNRSLGQALGVNETTIAARLRRLEDKGVMRVVATTDWRAFGLAHMAFVTVRVRDRSAVAVGEEIAECRDIIGVVTTSGGWDLIATILALDTAHLADVIGSAVSAVEGVEAVHCDLAVEIARFESRYAGLALDAHPIPLPPDTGERDDLDRAIIGALQRDARTSNRAIGAELDVSEATIRARVRRMEADGAIRIQAVSDVVHFGLLASGYLSVQAQPGAIDDVRDALLATQECGVVARTLGGTDFVSLLVCRSRDEMLSAALERIAHDPAVKAVSLLETHVPIKHVYTWAQL